MHTAIRRGVAKSMDDIRDLGNRASQEILKSPKLHAAIKPRRREEKTAFWVGFEKQAISTKLMRKAIRRAEDARELVSAISRAEGSAGAGVLAGKHGGHIERFKQALGAHMRKGELPLQRRKHLRKKFRDKAYSGAFVRRNHANLFQRLPVHPQAWLDTVQAARKNPEMAAALSKAIPENGPLDKKTLFKLTDYNMAQRKSWK
jgi:hypothetical protein